MVVTKIVRARVSHSCPSSTHPWGRPVDGQGSSGSHHWFIRSSRRAPATATAAMDSAVQKSSHRRTTPYAHHHCACATQDGTETSVHQNAFTCGGV